MDTCPKCHRTPVLNVAVGGIEWPHQKAITLVIAAIRSAPGHDGVGAPRTVNRQVAPGNRDCAVVRERKQSKSSKACCRCKTDLLISTAKVTS